MKKIVLLLLISAFSLTSMTTLDSATDDLKQLKEINARFIHNFVSNDAVAHAQLLHESFVQIDTKGFWLNREAYLEEWRSGFNPEKYLYWDYRDEKINIVGSTALIRSVTKYVILNNGKEITGMTQYTDTYVKEKGVWKCIQAQLTSVAPSHYPGDDTIVKKYIKGKLVQ